MWLSNYILNQGGAPAILEGLFADRPAAGVTGRIYVSTDTFAIYRDTGTGWDEIGGTNIGFVPYTGATQAVNLNTQQLQAGITTFSINAVALPADGVLNGLVLHTGGLDGYQNRFLQDSFGGSNNHIFRTSGGTNAAKTALTLNSTIGSITAFGYDGTGYSASNRGNIAFVAAENWSSTANGTYFYIDVCQKTTTTLLRALIASSNGNTLMGFSNDGNDDLTNKLQVNGTIGSLRLNVNGATDNALYQLNVAGIGAISSATTNYTAQLVLNDSTSANKLYLGSFSNSGYISLGGSYIAGAWTPNGTNAISNISMTGTNNSSTISLQTTSTNGVGPTTKLFVSELGDVTLGNTPTSGTGKFYANVTYLTRLNVNGATDNSLFPLNVNGTVNGSSPSFTGNTYTVTGNLSQQFYHVFTGAVGQTLTAPTPSGNNSQYLIINNSANVLTVAAFSGTNIITTLGATSATITLAANARTLLIADGNNKYYQAF